MLLQQSCIPINIKKILQQTILTESLLWKKIAWKLFYYFFYETKRLSLVTFGVRVYFSVHIILQKRFLTKY